MTNRVNGVIYAASMERKYTLAAKNSVFSLKEHFPSVHTTLYVESTIVDSECYELFDNVVTNNVPNNPRAKLWALSQTPYEKTLYLDADTLIESDEVQTVFDQLHDNNIVFTLIRPYNSNPQGYLDDPEYKYHGGVFLYDRKCLKFMKRWWSAWLEGTTGTWTYKHDRRMRVWDQFYLYHLLNNTPHGLKVGLFPEEARWNFVAGYTKSELGDKDAIISHYTIKSYEEQMWG